MAMAYIKVYYDQLEKLEPFSDAEVGRLIRGLLEYSMSGTEPDFKGNERFIWPTLRVAVDNDAEQYAAKCEKLRESGKNGRRGKKPNGSENNQMDNEEPNGSENNQMDLEKPNGSENNQMVPRIRNKEQEKDIPPKSPKGDERFNRFWSAYPRKIGKGAAQKTFSKLKVTDSLLEDMLDAIEEQKQSLQWRRDGGQYIPHPNTWLNQRRWEDEADEVPFEPSEDDFVVPDPVGSWESMYG